MADPRKELAVKLTGLREKSDQSISEVEKQTGDMNAMDKAIDVAKRLSGANVLSEEVKRKEGQLEDLGKEKDKVTQELQDSRLQIIQTQLGSKIDQLSETVKSGGSAKSIGEQIAEIKSVAGDLGLGTSKVSEFKDMANLIQSLNPHKDLAQQIKEAKDILSVLQPEKGKEAHVEGVPAEIAVQLKKMDTDLQIKLEEMKDARQKSDQDFKVTLKKWEEERDIRRQEVDGKILVERERNQMIAGGLEIIGKAAGKAYAESGGIATSPGHINQSQPAGPKTGHIEIGQDQSGTFECPSCHSPIGVGPTSVTAQCVKCNSQFPIVRVPSSDPGKIASESAATESESVPEHYEEE